jgi:hypothetical protein
MFERPAEHVAKDFATLRHVEGEEICKRRKVVEGAVDSTATESQPPADLVGLALSGGGIRSASIGLGVLQSLHRLGLLKFVDYLSTVSGGGYIGCAYSSAVVAAREPPSANRFPLDNLAANSRGGTQEPSPQNSGQSPSIIRLIYGGKYLFRPWEATNKYLIGLFFNNLLLFSGLTAACSLLVILWRTMDYQAVRDFLGLMWLDSDVYVAFFPFLAFGLCWLIAWMLSYWKFDAEAPGRWAQRWLYFALAALLIGCVMLLVNGYSTVGLFQAFLGGDNKTTSDDLGKWLVGLLGTGLLPLLKPDLIKHGLNPRGLLDKLLFYTAGTALLVGIPLALIGLLGQQDLSDTATAPGHVIRSGDVYSWPAFCALVAPAAGDDFDSRDDKSEPPSEQLDDASQQKLASLRELAERGPLTQEDRDEFFRLSGKQMDYLGAALAWDLRKRDRLRSALDADYPHVWQRALIIGAWLLLDRGPVGQLWNVERDLAKQQTEFSALFSESVLTHPEMAYALIKGDHPLTKLLDPPATERGSVSLPDVPAVIMWLDARKMTLDGDLRELIDDAGLSSQTDWYADDRKEFNRALLLATHPECFWKPDEIYRWNVIEADQRIRWWVFGISAAIFALALLVNLNTTSLHRFYRNRLAYAYLTGGHDSRPRLNLSEMHTTEYGAPYHLINATVNLSRPRFLDEVDRECEEEGAERRDAQSFLFSKLFCGSSATGWANTKSFEDFLDDNVSVSDAMAISGAAVDTLELNSLPLALLGLALNLNLGQWLPNPKYRKPRFTPRAWKLLLDCRRSVEDAAYCSIADGGFSENLGLLPLLKRRCRLIVVVDAGCDERHDFTDLARAIRYARIHEGIQIRSVDRPYGRELDTRPLRLNKSGFCQQHFLLGRIVYPATHAGAAPQNGLLIYVKPSLTGDEGVDLLEQRRRDRSFPHHATDDQFYSAQDVESYRQLGFHIASDAGHLFKKFCPDGKSLWLLRRLDLDVVDKALARRRRQPGDLLAKKVPAAAPQMAAAVGSADTSANQHHEEAEENSGIGKTPPVDEPHAPPGESANPGRPR